MARTTTACAPAPAPGSADQDLLQRCRHLNSWVQTLLASGDQPRHDGAPTAGGGASARQQLPAPPPLCSRMSQKEGEVLLAQLLAADEAVDAASSKGAAQVKAAAPSPADEVDDLIGLLNMPAQQQPCSDCSRSADYRAELELQRAAAAAIEQQQQAAQPLLPPPPDQRHQQPPPPWSPGARQDSVRAAWRGFYERWGHQAAVTLQRCWRGRRARMRFLAQQHAALVLQACTRGWLARREGADRARLQQQQQQQQLAQQQQQHAAWQQERLEAARVLQCTVRCWLARRRLQQLQQEAAGAAVAVSTAAAAAAAGAGAAAVADADDGEGCCVALPPVAAASGRSSSAGSSRGASADALAAAARQLLVRSSTELRCAASVTGSTAGDGCVQALAMAMVQRAQELAALQQQQAAASALRTSMASSSARSLAAVLQLVKETGGEGVLLTGGAPLWSAALD